MKKVTDSPEDKQRRVLLKKLGALTGVVAIGSVPIAAHAVDCKCNQKSGCTCDTLVRCVCKGNT
jgi:hypothetical protein